MVDLDSDPTKLIEVVAIGKQLLMTRGALTTFSIANDVAKYFRHRARDVCGDAALAQGDRRDGPALADVGDPVRAIDVEVSWTDSLGKKSGKEYPPRPPALAAEMAPKQVRIVQTPA
jgi:hypothetical protein